MISPQNAIALGTDNIRDGDAVPAAIVGQLTNHCVSVDTEISVIFAYPQWRWCPIGAMQSYVAYTTRLDNLDAAAYANARSGPDRVLRQVNSTIDERNPIWDPPAAMLSLLCHFKEIYAAGQWQALARSPIDVAAPARNAPQRRTRCRSDPGSPSSGGAGRPRLWSADPPPRAPRDAVRARR